MGLDTSHGCWHGAYSSFMRWRCEIAKAAGLPPLRFMEGFYNHTDITHDDSYDAVQKLGYEQKHKWASDLIFGIYGNLPIKWECLKPSPLYELLYHSDCDGTIPSASCEGIANELEKLLPLLPSGDGGGHIGNWRDKTSDFIAGLRLAASRGEDIDFH